jgi:Cu(I)/Ag(I) efflux system membrane fusion protein
MRLILLSLLLAAGFFTACKDNGNNTATTETNTTAKAASAPAAPKSDLTQTQTDEMMNMLSGYYGLKDALVATDAGKADEAASKLLSAAEMFNHDLGEQPQFNEIHPQLKSVMSECEAIVAAKGDDIEKKREHFSAFSEAMFKVLKTANLKNGGVYQQYCPMAFNDKGANWLSAESEIKNPYFGKKMLECGEVKDSL